MMVVLGMLWRDEVSSVTSDRECIISDANETSLQTFSSYWAFIYFGRNPGNSTFLQRKCAVIQ